jgi:hypothetical protein
VDPRRAVDAPGLAVDLGDPPGQGRHPGGAGSLGAGQPGVVAGPRDLQDVAHQGHRELVAMVADEAEPQALSPAKKAVAFF